jgi:peptidoglycan/xylan/chitin deacetylase (PgdA/CDA1 family)
MWTVLSGDFDPALTNEKCLQHVLEYTRKGAIVVFHDSEKAYEKLVFTLPRMLEYFSSKGYRFEKITISN